MVVTGLLLVAGIDQVAGGASTASASVPASAPGVGPASAPGVGPASAPGVGPAVLLGPGGGHGTAISLDWAGYAVTGASVTSVAGSWTQPSALCTGRKATQAAAWVGIDGFASTDKTVQQIGTDADCTKGTKKRPGGASYYAWFELFPSAVVVLSPASYPVSPGDVLTASVTLVGSSYRLVITDGGRWGFATLQAVTGVAPLDSSAEWIVEAPTTCVRVKCKPFPLTNFGSVTFTGATANGLAVNSSVFTSHQVVMSKNKKGTVLKASPSALLPGGTSFSVTWLAI